MAQRSGDVPQASTKGPESAPNKINPLGRGVPLVECEGCGHDFHPDSSPNLVLCWLCDEHAAAESGGWSA
jgi:hypothetical protein